MNKVFSFRFRTLYLQLIYLLQVVQGSQVTRFLQETDTKSEDGNIEFSQNQGHLSDWNEHGQFILLDDTMLDHARSPLRDKNEFLRSNDQRSQINSRQDFDLHHIKADVHGQSSLDSELRPQQKFLKHLQQTKLCNCLKGTELNVPKHDQERCVVYARGPQLPDELLVHPKVPKYISLPEFQVFCGPQCQCSADQIKIICKGCESYAQHEINENKILINSQGLNRETTELQIIALLPDGQQVHRSTVRVRLVDLTCPPQLFKDFDGVLMVLNEHPKILNLLYDGPDQSQPSQCGQPTFSSNDKCLILRQQDDQPSIQLNTSVCNQTGVYDSQIQIKFDRFYRALSTINFQYQFQCVPNLNVVGSSLKDYYFDQRLIDQTSANGYLNINLGHWVSDSQCQTPFSQRLQLPLGEQQWFSYYEQNQTVHIFGYPDDLKDNLVVFELQVLVGDTVLKSSVTTVHFLRNFMPFKRKLQAYLDNRLTSTFLSYNPICKAVSDGTNCVNPRQATGLPYSITFDNSAEQAFLMVSDTFDAKWAFTETWSQPITVKTVLSSLNSCTSTKPCRVFVGDSANYLLNQQCGSDQTIESWEHTFECNLTGKYVTFEVHSRTYDGVVQLHEFRHWSYSIVPKSAMASETSNCSNSQLYKSAGVTSLGDLNCCSRRYYWQIPTGGCSGTFPQNILNLNVPYQIYEVYLVKGLSPAGYSKSIEVFIDGLSCGILSDKNTMASRTPISRVKCNTPLTGRTITFRYTVLTLPQLEQWNIINIFGNPATCNSGNIMIAQSQPAQTIAQNYASMFIPAFSDIVSGSTSPPTCGDRTCTSNHPNVPWDNANQRFKIQSNGLSDIAGTSTVSLSCSLTNHPSILPATATFNLTIPVYCGSGNSMIAPNLPDRTLNQTSNGTSIDAFSDNLSGATSPHTCGARTCMSDHQNVVWDKADQKFIVKTLGSADVAGAYLVSLSCKLANYPNIPTVTSSFTLTVQSSKIIQCQGNGKITASIGKTGQMFLDSSDKDSNYTITSIQSFEAYIKDSVLIVQSNDEGDVGEKKLQIQQVVYDKICFFSVTVYFNESSTNVTQSMAGSSQINDTSGDMQGSQSGTMSENQNQQTPKKYEESQADSHQVEAFDPFKNVKKSTQKSSKYANKLPQPDVYVKSISKTGHVELVFTSQMLVPNMTDFLGYQNTNDTKSRVLKQNFKPNLEVKVIPGIYSNPNDLGFTFNVTSFTKDFLTIELNFTNATQISSQEVPDHLQITFAQNQYFSDIFGQTLPKNLSLNKKLPRQMHRTKFSQTLSATSQSVKSSTIAIIGTNFVLNVLLSASMNFMWSMVDSQQIILMMPLWEINMPAHTAMVFGYIFQIANFDLLPTSEIWHYFFPDIPQTNVINSKLESVGYSNEYLIFNLGTILFSFVAYLLMIPCYFLIKFMKNKIPSLQRTFIWFHELTFWNYPITLITESFASIAMCVMINFLNVSQHFLFFSFSGTVEEKFLVVCQRSCFYFQQRSYQFGYVVSHSYSSKTLKNLKKFLEHFTKNCTYQEAEQSFQQK